MECLLQYWDELDDLVWLLAAMRERIRSGVLMLFGMTATVAALGLGVLAAGANPLAALSVAAVLAYGLMLRVVFGEPEFEPS